MSNYPWLFRLGVVSKSAGRWRRNEDGAAYLVPHGSWSRHGALFAVADGVGGRPCGTLAARIALTTFVRAYYRGRGHKTRKLYRAVQSAHKALRRYGQLHPVCHGLASTLTALLVSRDRFYVVHVGDTRAYVIRQHNIVKLTRDHTLGAQMRARYGDVMHQYDHVLWQSMGGSSSVHPDVVSYHVHSGDTFLIATDGVYRYLPAAHIGWFAEHYAPSQATALIERWAQNAGSPDDRTILIAQAVPMIAKTRWNVSQYGQRSPVWSYSL